MKKDTQFTNGKIGSAEIKDHFSNLIKNKGGTEHKKILSEMLNQISPVDFKRLAKLTGDEKLQIRHMLIISIQQILIIATRNNWGLCRNHVTYGFNGNYWDMLEIDVLRTFLGEAAEKLGVDQFYARHFSFRNNLYKQFLALAVLPKPDRPKDLVLVNLKNGTYEISKEGRKLREHDRADFLTYILSFDYDPSAQAPLFQKFLDRVLPDVSLQKILSEYLGYVFTRTSTLKLEKVLLLYGPGANGKSVFFEICLALLGASNVTAFSMRSLTNENGYYRATIANKLLNYTSELDGIQEMSYFKQLASGEKIEARLPYGEPFNIEDYAKFIFNCNQLPKEVEITEAYFRRPLIVPFTQIIPEAEQDKHLAEKIIKSELSGIFNWVLKGLERILDQNGFSESEASNAILKLYKKEADNTKLFFEENEYSKSTDKFVAIKHLYNQYREFCQESGFKPLNKTNFCKRLEDSGIIIERRNVGKVAFVEKQVVELTEKTLSDPSPFSLLTTETN